MKFPKICINKTIFLPFLACFGSDGDSTATPDDDGRLIPSRNLAEAAPFECSVSWPRTPADLVDAAAAVDAVAAAAAALARGPTQKDTG